MRAWELYKGEGLERHRTIARQSILSLREINKLKRLKASQRAEREQRRALWRVMYSQDDVVERELDEREVALNAREEQVRLKELQADIKKAINDAELDQKSRNRLHQMAMAELRRIQKKQPSG